MRKMINKQVSFILALLMIMVTVVSAIMPAKAYAEEGKYTLKLKNDGKTDHKFEIYQIFKGELSEGTLSNIEWGDGIKGESKGILGEAAKKAETIKTPEEAKDFAEKIQDHLSNINKSISIKPGETGTVDKLEPGYYLVKDTAKSQDGKANGAYTLYILKVVGNVTASTKLDVPTVEKKVQENSNKEWQDAVDYNIGDIIPFKVTGTLPKNYDKYETYKYSFHDKMSQGLTLKEDSIKVTINGKVIDKSKYKVDVKKDDNSFSVTFDNLKEIKDPVITSNSKVVLEYNAELNQNAVTGEKGNDNTVYLEYSNNPNKGGDGDYGRTPKDKNIVFTYLVNVNKKNEQGQPLKGAEFTLLKKEGNTEKVVKTFTIDNTGTKFTVKGLDAGEYILRETKTPNGYNTIKDVKFKITADYDKNSDDPKLNSLTGTETINLGILTFTPDKKEGSLSTDVVNKKGFKLPETGGMGRTLIYVMGGIFVVAALGYMGYKKRHTAR